MAGFRRLDETVLHRGHLISLAEGTFEAPDGRRFERDVVHHPGAVSVVPVTDAGEVVLVRQYRAAVDDELLEIPAGKRDKHGEDPETTARRELEEEVGFSADHLEPLARFYNSPGFCDEDSHVFAARGLRAVPRESQGVEEEHLTVHHVPLGEVAAMIADGRIRDAKTIIGLSLVLLREGLG